MLLNLKIRNYALISHQEIDFRDGFTVLTGETGAGKSIILGALDLVMGARADARAVADGQQKCVIEAEFDIADYDLAGFFDENGLDNDDARHCLLRREVTAQGKSRAFVNDTPVNLAVLRQLTDRFIDIHSQHENLLLRTEDFQLRFVDLMACSSTVLADYRDAWHQWRRLTADLQHLREELARQAEQQDYIAYQYRQLDEAKLRDGELEELEEEHRMLTHSGDIKTYAGQLLQNLTGDEGILSRLKTAESAMQWLERYVPQAKDFAGRLQSAYIDIDDIASEIDRIGENAELDPQRLEFVEQRIDTINTLLKKHNVSTERDLLDLCERFQGQLQRLDNAEEDIRELERQVGKAYKDVARLAGELTALRESQAAPLERELTGRLSDLGIAHPKIVVEISPLAASDASPLYTLSGQDRITLLFSANLNQAPRPISEVASGGEISRLMLCIKALMAQRQALPTVIFDEIDTGISGDVAGRVGSVMADMANNLQVIAITHLPQIAAKAQHHFRVFKQDTATATETCIEPLDDAQRVMEIATMLSGTPPTPSAQTTARELLG